MKMPSGLLVKGDSFVRQLFALGYRLTGHRFFVRAYRWRRDMLLSVDELIAMGARHRTHPGPMLIFGVGNDSLFWNVLNLGQPTAFLENDPQWRTQIAAQSRSLQIYDVTYTTRLAEMRLPEENQEPPPALSLPPAIRDRKWQTILVDAPQGWGDAPGRIQSIHEARQLVADGGRIFVHDCDREGERYLVSVYLRDFRCTELLPRLWLFEKA